MASEITTETTNRSGWSLATRAERLATLVGLWTSLPSRTPTDLATVEAAYMTALEGVTIGGLSLMRKAVLKGAAGHPFMPAPPELRIIYETAMGPMYEARSRKLREETIRLERPRPMPPLSPEERQRGEERMAAFRDVMAEAQPPSFPAQAKVVHSAVTKALIEAGKHRPAEENAEINPPDWAEGKTLPVTKALLGLLKAQNDEDEE